MKLSISSIQKSILAGSFCLCSAVAQALPYAAEVLDGVGADYVCATLDKADEVNGEELLPFGNMDRWYTRNITESKILGGRTVTLMEVAPSGTSSSNSPYKNMGGSPWATSNVYAKLAGIVKTNVSVYRDTHAGHGSCAKLYSHLVDCKVLGIVDVEVFAAGSLFLGSVEEPITGASNPYGKINFGIPFTRKPKAVMFDYKTQIVAGNRIKKGVGSRSVVKGQDLAEVVCFLQKRTEDAKGNITAVRVGTMVKRFSKSTGWVDNASFTINYGDITKQSYYNASSMGLSGKDGVERQAKNSKGRLVPIKETGWDGSATPTHVILQFSSSHGGAYVGTVGNTLWVDNVRWVF